MYSATRLFKAVQDLQRQPFCAAKQQHFSGEFSHYHIAFHQYRSRYTQPVGLESTDDPLWSTNEGAIVDTWVTIWLQPPVYGL